jgi:hypothetical protein
MLQRQIDVLDDLVALGHRLEHFVGDGRRIEIEQPDPVDTVNLVQLAQKRWERRAFARGLFRRTSCPGRSG